MGAVLNMRPDLFNAAIMGVPFVDVVTTMMDESIPLTNIEWEEWGNPKVSYPSLQFLLVSSACVSATLLAKCVCHIIQTVSTSRTTAVHII